MLSGQNDVTSWVDDTDQDDAVSLPLDCHDWYVTPGNINVNPLPLRPPPQQHLFHQATSFYPQFINPFDPSTSYTFPPDPTSLLGPGYTQPEPGPVMDLGFSGLENFDPARLAGARSTLFEKRAGSGVIGKRKRSDFCEEDVEGNYCYDSEDGNDYNNNYDNGGSEFNYSYSEKGEGDYSNSNANSVVTGGGGESKGKRKGMPAKNLMAERRRRKKLNDRLYMLRSVVPKISKV